MHRDQAGNMPQFKNFRIFPAQLIDDAAECSLGKQLAGGERTGTAGVRVFPDVA
jgi:hypothetical protein